MFKQRVVAILLCVACAVISPTTRADEVDDNAIKDKALLAEIREQQESPLVTDAALGAIAVALFHDETANARTKTVWAFLKTVRGSWTSRMVNEIHTNVEEIAEQKLTNEDVFSFVDKMLVTPNNNWVVAVLTLRGADILADRYSARARRLIAHVLVTIERSHKEPGQSEALSALKALLEKK